MQSFCCEKCDKSFTFHVAPSFINGRYLATCPICGSKIIIDTDTAILTAKEMVGLFYPSYLNDIRQKISQLGD